MTYDVGYRFAQALDPSGLDTIAACLHAIQAAAKDCRNAGKPFETDPAVVLLAQHLAAVARAKMPDRAALRSLCGQAVAEIARTPLLTVLAARGVDHDADAKRTFHTEARRALRRLAEALQLASGTYEIRVCAGGPAVSGEVILHGDELYVQVSIGGFGRGEILLRRCRGRSDYVGERNHWARMAELVDPATLAARIARELGLAMPVELQPRLVA
ncbi:hypothetical protein [Sphingomonas rubra]|uniref:Uncharacterized protein n=1 Tax=Sphingomonas rubra TaxID=634430 RepID=A0A1I5Q6C8_9SPHN|nr:hypothetical protein [Sphingomonas rubra]SFP41416.1 hypothetical protein SAMN04488241_101466 [Sphingomonas rubra]